MIFFLKKMFWCNILLSLSLRIIETYRTVLLLAGSAMSLPASSPPIHDHTLKCFASNLSVPGAENVADTRWEGESPGEGRDPRST